MPTTYKVLGQSSPTADTDTTLYTVPSATQTVVSTITVCNRSGSIDIFNIAVRPAGASIANQHYVFFSEPIGGSSSVILTIGMTLATTDIITVRSLNGNTSFNAFGSEIS
jgi:hypothetical protein